VEYRNPKPTVDAVIDLGPGIVLIKRKNPPFGWALPGGFVDEGERVEAAAVREAREETGLDVTLEDLLYVYSDPDRDSRMHTLSIVFTARATGQPQAADDAADVRIVSHDTLRSLLQHSEPVLEGLPFAFDHAAILRDYVAWCGGRRRRPVHP
jgi:8-oxo-dGTP diphosphatase